MTQVSESSVTRQVANIALELGYRVTLHPTRIPSKRPWTDGLASFVRGRRYRPDMLIEHGNSFAIVEVKSRPVLLGRITQSKEYADHFGAAVVLCLPDDSFHRTPASVKEYAVGQKICLCPLSKVGEALKELLD